MTSDPHAAAAQLLTIKQTLGRTNYKTLKSLTVRFTTNAIDPAEYVDETAGLFEGGARIRSSGGSCRR